MTPMQGQKGTVFVFRLAVGMVSQGLGVVEGRLEKPPVRKSQTIFLYCWQQVNQNGNTSQDYAV
ncbi:MAG: hypothetical protein ACLSHC_13190 [Bilophila wadsworthia]